MAERNLVLTFSWENEAEFKLQANEDGGGNKTIVEMEEDGNISVLWGGIRVAMDAYWRTKLDMIGDEMKL